MEDFVKEMGFEQILEQEVVLPHVEERGASWEEIIYKDTELETSTVPMENEACVCFEIKEL